MPDRRLARVRDAYRENWDLSPLIPGPSLQFVGHSFQPDPRDLVLREECPEFDRYEPTTDTPWAV